jgi:hypothetical protein
VVALPRLLPRRESDMPRTVHDPSRNRVRSPNPADGLGSERLAQLPKVAPNAWLGECDCIIGPFAERRIAAAFANAMVEFGQYEGICERVVIYQDAYYVLAAAVGQESVVLA